MSARRLLALLTCALIVAGGAYYTLAGHDAKRADPAVGTRVLPGLAERLGTIATIRIVGGGQRTLLTLSRRADQWQVDEYGYPADDARARRVLLALAELRIVETKTADPARYAALGVDEPAGEASQALRVELRGAGPPIALLVGRPAGERGGYVRLPGSAAALEARPALDLARMPRDWLSRTIVDLAAERVQSVEVRPASGPAWLAQRADRAAAHFSVALPKGRELTSLGAADGAAHALGALELEDLRRVTNPDAVPRPEGMVVRCFDGLIVTLEGREQQAEHWIRVRAEYDTAVADRFRDGTTPPVTDGARQQAERLTRIASGWEYRIAAYRYEALFRKRDDFARH